MLHARPFPHRRTFSPDGFAAGRRQSSGRKGRTILREKVLKMEQLMAHLLWSEAAVCTSLSVRILTQPKSIYISLNLSLFCTRIFPECSDLEFTCWNSRTLCCVVRLWNKVLGKDSGMCLFFNWYAGKFSEHCLWMTRTNLSHQVLRSFEAHPFQKLPNFTHWTRFSLKLENGNVEMPLMGSKAGALRIKKLY